MQLTFPLTQQPEEGVTVVLVEPERKGTQLVVSAFMSKGRWCGSSTGNDLTDVLLPGTYWHYILPPPKPS